MRKFTVLAAVVAFAASTAVPSVSAAQDMILLCENGSVAELICTYVRDANGNIVVKECHWSC